MTDTADRPTVFMLHGLGLSGDLFDLVVEALGDWVDAVALDLPGFGVAADETDTSIDATVRAVERAVAERGPSRWLLVGHSMGGKIASLVAARTLSGQAPLFGLVGVVLLSASPPSLEPMPDEQRSEMLSWVASGPLDADSARAFVDGNVGAPLEAKVDALILSEVRRSSPAAWQAWLTTGSREDRTTEVGALDLPAAILAGSEDPSLGPDPQRQLNGTVLPRARVTVLDGARHLLPVERPAEVAAAIREVVELGRLGPVVPPEVARLIASDRVSVRTRSALARRAVADDPDYAPVALSAAQLATLRAVADRVVPQDPWPPIDLAARVDGQLGRGEGDGWRFADLPPDATAYRAALDALTDFTELDAEQQDARLAAVAAKEVQGGGLTAAQLVRWFEDARNDLVHQWLAHPATMARIGYDGYATGGERLTGFTLVAADTHEDWEVL